jgi:hypothetical protein
MRAGVGMALAAASLAAAPLLGQSIASRVNAVRDGTVQLVFPSRPEVCGDGRGSTMTIDNGGYRSNFNCIHGPITVTLGRADNQTVSVRSCVACRSRSDATTTIEASADEAARYLLELGRTLGGSSSDNAISAAAFSDAQNLSPDLAQLVRDGDATMSARRQALFWLGQGDFPTREIVNLDSQLQTPALRDQYVFVLSQRHDDPALDKLIDIARHDPSIDVRKKAMFWLGQSHEPKALRFFKEILSP